MKMSDVFKLPVNEVAMELDYNQVTDATGVLIAPFDAVDLAVNQHDKLIEFVGFTAKYSVDEQVKMQAIDLLSELNK